MYVHVYCLVIALIVVYCVYCVTVQVQTVCYTSWL